MGWLHGPPLDDLIERLRSDHIPTLWATADELARQKDRWP
jgi:hypothetical protein